MQALLISDLVLLLLGLIGSRLGALMIFHKMSPMTHYNYL